jgi:hypothetical protein
MNYFWKGLFNGSFSQMIVTALWEIDDPALGELRRWCMLLYGIALALFFVSLFLVFRSFQLFASAGIVSFILWTIASGMAEVIEVRVLQQKKNDPEPESDEA